MIFGWVESISTVQEETKKPEMVLLLLHSQETRGLDKDFWG